MFQLFHISFIKFTILDLIDIGIVTFLLFRLYQALKNTIAVQVLVGLIFMLGIYFVTQAVNLRSVNWILTAISNIWLIGFIILFQPELRRVILIITRTSIFRFFAESRIHETIGEMLEAVKEMSEKHIGALIVFSRSRNIRMTIETGIQIQGVLSKELLMSIFNTKSPLHDGAVIVQNGMIEAAGCILPLTSATKTDSRKLGTRHRAALGISEQADVFVVVVSEETGKISIAEEGKLNQGLTMEELATVLKEHLSVESSHSREKEMFELAK